MDSYSTISVIYNIKVEWNSSVVPSFSFPEWYISSTPYNIQFFIDYAKLGAAGCAVTSNNKEEQRPVLHKKSNA